MKSLLSGISTTSSVIFFGVCSMAQAVFYQWDPNGAEAGLGGPGDWVGAVLDVASSGLNDGTDPTVDVVLTSVDSVRFGGDVGGLVTHASGSKTLNSMVFATSGYSIAGDGMISLQGASPKITTHRDAEVGCTISGSSGLLKDGVGVLTLSKINSFTGGTTVAQGTLKLSGGALRGDVTVRVGATFDEGGKNTTSVVLEGGTYTTQTATSSANLDVGPLRLATGGKLLVGGGGTMRFVRNIAGVGNLTLNGKFDARLLTEFQMAGDLILEAGQLTVNGNMMKFNHTGGVQLQAGTMVVNNQPTIRDFSGTGGSLTLSSNLILDQTKSSSFNGTVGGTGGLIKQGEGELSLLKGNTYSGTTVVSQGVLKLGSSFALGSVAAGTRVITGGVLDLAGCSVGSEVLTVSEGTILNSSSLSASAQSLVMESDGVVDGRGAMVVLNQVSGSGRLTVDGGVSGGLRMADASSRVANAGGVWLRSGVLDLPVNASVTGGAVVVAGGVLITRGGDAIADHLPVVVDSGEWRMLAGESVGGLSGVGGKVSLGSNGLVVDSVGLSEYGGSLQGGGSLQKSGTGTWVVSGSNQLTGEISVVAGELRWSGDQSLVTGSCVASHVGTVISGQAVYGGAISLRHGAELEPGQDGVGRMTVGMGVSVDHASRCRFVVQVDGSVNRLVLAEGSVLDMKGSVVLQSHERGFHVGDRMDLVDGGEIVGVPQMSPSTPGEGLVWDLSAWTTEGVIGVVSASGSYDEWVTAVEDESQRGHHHDPDGDGYSNFQEYAFGTQPHRHDAGLCHGSVEGEHLVMRWKQRLAGVVYHLEESETVSANSWKPSTLSIEHDGPVVAGHQPRVVRIPRVGAKKFFRLVANSAN